MKEIPRISDTEWQVMKVIWAKAPCTASMIIEALETSTDWKPKTVKSLISRLVGKNAVGYTQENRTYHYYPLVDEEECIKAESKSFLDKVFNGAFNTMLASFVEENRFTEEELDELKKILEKGKDKKGGI